MVNFLARLFGKLFVKFPEEVDLVIFGFFQIQQRIMCPPRRPDQFVQFDLDRFGIPVLGVLNDENCNRAFEQLQKLSF